MNKILLDIKNLEISINNLKIIENFNLTINENETHIIMGPNGSGKSTFLKALTGHPSYKLIATKLEFIDKNLITLSPEERFHLGLFLAFQYPLEITGLTTFDFLKIAYNEHQKYLNQVELSPLEILSLINNYLKKLKISPTLLKRDLNVGFSGGEKKQNEILQMLLLKPKLILLDELDSGLDINTIKLIYQDILNNRSPGQSLIIVTHYPKIIEYINPTAIHILKKGKLVKTSNTQILPILEQSGYETF